ncbi:MAG: hypothetical protein KME32_24740 [Mojavia pulchra JT2-VF2]|uniref:Uncharacterized protein n=1 Tax=Mojavia pulchra JT2-VF2 TaxID=287848 RepID=A0A951UIE9_9NOST|nr:hypothetical protein [Mojavia pulchra JT2-VF2]
MAVFAVELFDDDLVTLPLAVRTIDRSLGKARQAAVLIKVSNAASCKAIGNHRLEK